MFRVNVFLGEKFLGQTDLMPRSFLKKLSIVDAVKAAVTIVCFMREDDLLSTHSWQDFTVKSC